MKVKPLLFSTPMVQALLDGRKTRTRRVIKNPEQWDLEPQGDGLVTFEDAYGDFHDILTVPQYGKVGDYIWVRETFAVWDDGIVYKTCGVDGVTKWKPSIFMPKAASRITLEITNVKVERLQDISEEDSLAEGVLECDGMFDEVEYCKYAKEMGLVLHDSKPMYR